MQRWTHLRDEYKSHTAGEGVLLENVPVCEDRSTEGVVENDDKRARVGQLIRPSGYKLECLGGGSKMPGDEACLPARNEFAGL